jgi:hypothetical protein
MLNRRKQWLCVSLFVALPLGAASAQNDRGPIDQDIQVSLGGFFMQFDTDVRLDGDTSTGTDVNWEDELGFQDKDRFRLDAFWRFTPRQKVRFMWFQNNRSSTRTLTRDIDFGDQTYPVTTTVDAGLDEQIIELAYEFAFYQRENLEISASAGIHNVQVKATLRGDVASPGGGGTVEQSGKADGNGPLPVIGARLLWGMGSNFYLDALAQFFAIEFENYDGSLEDYKVGVTWFPTKNFGVGLAYNQFVTRLDVAKERFNGTLRVEYAGPMAYFTVGF